ncbi:MAG: FtsW/RodA/SpoVE family cell cycle protein [Lachnospiraceae bacterium]|nr:FtsW/RodA/SpoVE family cell cycle protein [Lachnospiraceae bacterium]
MLKQYRLSDYNFRLVLWVTALSVLGILVVGSAEQSYMSRQLFGFVLGMVLMIVISLMDYTWILNFSWFIYLGANVLLLLVIFSGFGSSGGGATRWLTIAGFRFQPSDIAKIMLILFFARFFEDHEETLNTFRIILISMILIGIPLFLIIEEPDLSTTIVLALVFCALIFMAGLSYKIIAGILIVCIPVGVIFISLIMQPDQTIVQEYQMTRIYAWLYPDEYPSDSMQQQNSIKAIASGQLYGKGLDNDDVESVKNGDFISQDQTDFIFAVAGEELGFIGCCIIVLLEFLITFECLMIGRRAKSLSGTLIAGGVGILVSFQSFVNIAVATGLLPNTGLTLPFVSYGLTSLVSFCIGIGFVLNVGLQSRKY